MRVMRNSAVKDQILKKLISDQGQRPRTLYSSLPVHHDGCCYVVRKIYLLVEMWGLNVCLSPIHQFLIC